MRRATPAKRLGKAKATKKVVKKASSTTSEVPARARAARRRY